MFDLIIDHFKPPNFYRNNFHDEVLTWYFNFYFRSMKTIWQKSKFEAPKHDYLTIIQHTKTINVKLTMFIHFDHQTEGLLIHLLHCVTFILPNMHLQIFISNMHQNFHALISKFEIWFCFEIYHKWFDHFHYNLTTCS
jgi:hypothetical protein